MLSVCCISIRMVVMVVVLIVVVAVVVTAGEFRHRNIVLSIRSNDSNSNW